MNQSQIYGLLMIASGSGKRAKPAEIAEDLQCSPDLVWKNVQGTRTSPRVREHIAGLLELPVAMLWPPDQAAA